MDFYANYADHSTPGQSAAAVHPPPDTQRSVSAAVQLGGCFHRRQRGRRAGFGRHRRHHGHLQSVCHGHHRLYRGPVRFGGAAVRHGRAEVPHGAPLFLYRSAGGHFCRRFPGRHSFHRSNFNPFGYPPGHLCKRRVLSENPSDRHSFSRRLQYLFRHSPGRRHQPGAPVGHFDFLRRQRAAGPCVCGRAALRGPPAPPLPPSSPKLP